MSIAAPRSYGAVVKPCIECGEPSTESRCDEHQLQPWRHHEGIARARGYDAAWDKLSRRARRLQPFCSDCYTTENLSTDRKPAHGSARPRASRSGSATSTWSPCPATSSAERLDPRGRAPRSTARDRRVRRKARYIPP
jgi:hypothetical protein